MTPETDKQFVERIWERVVARVGLSLEDDARLFALALRGAETHRVKSSLERMLLEFDFLIEGGVLPDIRNDIIFDEARAALTALGEPK